MVSFLVQSERLGFSTVGPNQRKSIKAFLKGNDVFVSLPTGSGKSLCYALLPYAFDEFRGRDGSIAIIVSPLKTLMKNQVSYRVLGEGILVIRIVAGRFTNF